MNTIIQALHDRKSTRQFTTQAISQEDFHAIIDAAIQAPTAGNQMLYSIIHVSDQAIKDRLAKTCDNQPFIAKAPLLLIFLADCRKWYDLYQTAAANPRAPGVGDLLLAIEDAMIAAQNAVIAAQSLGIGSCYIGDILENAETHIELLKLDDYVLPITMLVMGYPTEKQKKRPKPARFNRQYLLFENSYTRLSKAQQRSMLSEVHGEGFNFDHYVKKFCERKYHADFSREMTRSVQLYIEKFLGAAH